MLLLQNLSCFYTLPCWCQLDQNSFFGNANGFVELWRFSMSQKSWINAERTSMMWRALEMDAFVSKEKRASTSVETFPGTFFRISLPNSTSNRSRVASTLSSRSWPYSVDQWMVNREKLSNRSIEPMLEVNDLTYMLLAIFDGNID